MGVMAGHYLPLFSSLGKRYAKSSSARNEANEVIKIMRSIEKAIAKKLNSLTGYKASDKTRADDALKKLRSHHLEWDFDGLLRSDPAVGDF